MEPRKVTIINNRTQSQRIIQASTATTLGELKREMSEAGIEYHGMTFFEGHLRAELKDDASILPTNIPYKGQVVNDLIFLLTAPNKKIKSGSMSEERTKAYQGINTLGLQAECVNRFGKNYTMCKTKDLVELIKEHTSGSVASGEGSTPSDKHTVNVEHLTEAFITLIESLESNGQLDEDTYDKCMGLVRGSYEPSEGEDERLSQSEIDEFFDFVKE